MEETFTVHHRANALTAFIIGEKPTLRSAVRLVKTRYRGRMTPEGVGQVDIVDKDGNVVRKFKVR